MRRDPGLIGRYARGLLDTRQGPGRPRHQGTVSVMPSLRDGAWLCLGRNKHGGIAQMT